MIRKVKGGYVIMHCHDKKTGRMERIPATRKPVTYAKALEIHQAIMASRSRRLKVKTAKK